MTSALFDDFQRIVGHFGVSARGVAAPGEGDENLSNFLVRTAGAVRHHKPVNFFNTL